MNKIKNKKCEVKGCKEKATAIIRTKYVCKRHYHEFKMDNVRKNHLGKSITKSLKVN